LVVDITAHAFGSTPGISIAEQARAGGGVTPTAAANEFAADSAAGPNV